MRSSVLELLCLCSTCKSCGRVSLVRHQKSHITISYCLSMCRWTGAELDCNQDDPQQTVVNWKIAHLHAGGAALSRVIMLSWAELSCHVQMERR